MNLCHCLWGLSANEASMSMAVFCRACRLIPIHHNLKDWDILTCNQDDLKACHPKGISWWHSAVQVGWPWSLPPESHHLVTLWIASRMQPRHATLGALLGSRVVVFRGEREPGADLKRGGTWNRTHQNSRVSLLVTVTTVGHRQPVTATQCDHLPQHSWIPSCITLIKVQSLDATRKPVLASAYSQWQIECNSD